MSDPLEEFGTEGVLGERIRHLPNDFYEWMRRVVGEDEVLPEVQLRVGEQEYLLRNVRVSIGIGPVVADGVEEAEILFTFEEEPR